MIKLKRVYEKLQKGEGYRILVDRLWPRGLSKEKAAVDLWLKEIAPSNELRKWFSHEPRKWAGFQERYKKEMKGRKNLLGAIKQLEKEKGAVVLLYSARDGQHNNAVVLRNVLKMSEIFH